MDSRSEARKESRRCYSDSVGQRVALLPYQGSKRSDAPGSPSCFGLAAICAIETPRGCRESTFSGHSCRSRVMSPLLAKMNSLSCVSCRPTPAMWLASCGETKHACFFCNARSEDGEWV
jgi:hypothetical protein